MYEETETELPVEGVAVEAAVNIGGVVSVLHGRVAAWLPDGATLLLRGEAQVGQELSLRLSGVSGTVLNLFSGSPAAPADRLDIETHAVVRDAVCADGLPEWRVSIVFPGRFRILGRSARAKGGSSRRSS